MGTGIPKGWHGVGAGWLSRLCAGTELSPLTLVLAFLGFSGALWDPQHCSYVSASSLAPRRADSCLSDLGLNPTATRWLLRWVQDGGNFFCCLALAVLPGCVEEDRAAPIPDVQPPHSCCPAGLPQPGGDVKSSCTECGCSVEGKGLAGDVCRRARTAFAFCFSRANGGKSRRSAGKPGRCDRGAAEGGCARAMTRGAKTWRGELAGSRACADGEGFHTSQGTEC